MWRALKNIPAQLLKGMAWLLFPDSADEQTTAALNIETLTRLLRVRHIRGTTTLLPYRNEHVRALVWQLKYKQDQRAAALLGELLARYLAQESGPFVIIPMPLSPHRLRERGYNQVELVARAACRYHAGLLLRTDVLLRTEHTERQTRLPRLLRLTNVAHAFAAESDPPSGRILLLDDVLTTGSTMRAAKSALTKAGIVDVRCLALTF